nr:hypothetical protein Iba_chr04fCG14310 [Ipomoea batatas]
MCDQAFKGIVSNLVDEIFIRQTSPPPCDFARRRRQPTSRVLPFVDDEAAAQYPSPPLADDEVACGATYAPADHKAAVHWKTPHLFSGLRLPPLADGEACCRGLRLRHLPPNDRRSCCGAALRPC